MSYSEDGNSSSEVENPFGEELEQLIEEEEINKADFEERNPTLDFEETWDFNYAYKMYLERSLSLIIGIPTGEYRNPWRAIEDVSRSNYLLNSEYVKFMRKMVEDSIKMKAKIEELEERQLEQRLINLRKNGGSHKSHRNRKTIKNKSRK
jgi:hypothetical protein